MKYPRLKKTDTQGHDYSEKVISTPLNDRKRALSGVEGYTSRIEH